MKCLKKIKEVLIKLQVSIYFHEIFELIPKFAKFMQVLLKAVKEKLTKE